MELGYLVLSIVKIVAILAYLYGLLKILDHPNKWVRIVGILLAFGIVQAALSIKFDSFQILNDFDKGLLFQASAMTMIALGLNLIYGFNGQFSLGQWGFYGLGAYASADVTYRWVNGDARGMLVLGSGVILGGLMIWGLGAFLKRYRIIPVLSSFTLYLIGALVVGFVAIQIGRFFDPMLHTALGVSTAPGPFNSPAAMQVVYFLAVIFAGVFAAEISFLFGLPVLSLGSDYFGIATLGFTIVVNVLMVNSDTILPFPEMKGGRGMIGIPQLTNWFWAFFFMVAIIIIMRNLIQSSTGRAMMAVREDETAARAMGIDVANNKLLAFVIGSFFAGIGGAVYAHYIGFLSPGTFTFLYGFNPLIIVVFGGLGSMTGTITASFAWIFFLEGLLRVILSQLGTEAPTWRFVLYPIALLLVMLLRPAGLLGSVEWGFLRAKPPALRKPKETTPATNSAGD
ncbi:MAG: branched-chain amino acid ABC transporter permease [Anaerolineaceae bacterium]